MRLIHDRAHDGVARIARTTAAVEGQFVEAPAAEHTLKRHVCTAIRFIAVQ
jgi:hypothetical protein